MAPPVKKRAAAPETKRTKKRLPDPSGAGKRPRVDPNATAEQVLQSKKNANLVFDLLELLEVRPAPEAEGTWPQPHLLFAWRFSSGAVRLDLSMSTTLCCARNSFVEATPVC